MSIEISFDFSDLGRPEVVQAFLGLCGALAPRGRGRRARGGLAALVGAPGNGAAPRRGRAARAAAPKKPRKRRPAAKPGTKEWNDWLGEQPEAAKKFLTALSGKGRLTMPEAMKEVGTKEPKSIGGITGAMSRWAPFELPIRAGKTKSGERFWEWKAK